MSATKMHPEIGARLKPQPAIPLWTLHVLRENAHLLEEKADFFDPSRKVGCLGSSGVLLGMWGEGAPRVFTDVGRVDATNPLFQHLGAGA